VLTKLNGKQIEYNEIVMLATQIAPSITDDDSRFNEVSSLNRILELIPADQIEKQTPEEKWKNIFVDGNFPCLLTLISMIFSVPVSNSFIETVFSLAKAQWTDSRNSLLPATVKALLQVKVNYDFNCSEMHSYLIGNKDLLQKIQGNEKYDA
jgi:hypothetical protein